MKWQVLLGARLRRWRKASTKDRQKQVPALLTRDALSQIEWGHRRVDAVELRALASHYGKSEADIGALFAPATDEEWRGEVNQRVPDPVFTMKPQVRLHLDATQRDRRP